MICSNCGGTVQEGSTFCTYCGMPVRAASEPPRSEDVQRLKEALDASAEERRRSDRHISRAWAVVPFVVIVAGVVLMMAFAFAEMFDRLEDWPAEGDPAWAEDMSDTFTAATWISSSIGLVAYIILGKLSYDLVKRSNMHFDREDRLRGAIMSFLYPKGNFRSGFHMPPGAEKRRSPPLWGAVVIMSAALSMPMLLISVDMSLDAPMLLLATVLMLMSLVLFIMEIYMLNFLTADIGGHNERWAGFVAETKMELARMGFRAGELRAPSRLPDRSTAIYVILTIFTGGLFMFYWWYAAVKDGNAHFEKQMYFEGDLRALLENPPQAVREEDGEVSPSA